MEDEPAAIPGWDKFLNAHHVAVLGLSLALPDSWMQFQHLLLISEIGTLLNKWASRESEMKYILGQILLGAPIVNVRGRLPLEKIRSLFVHTSCLRILTNQVGVKQGYAWLDSLEITMWTNQFMGFQSQRARQCPEGVQCSSSHSLPPHTPKEVPSVYSLFLMGLTS